jgi:UDP-glucose 4-epimerase
VRYLVTGGSGYIGGRLVDRLLEQGDTERVIVCDVRSPPRQQAGAEFRHLDVTDAARVRDVVERERPDALLHLAFFVDPIHDEGAMYAVDVGGTQNVLEAASAAGVGHVLVTSSATAYGAFPDNPVPLTEEHPVRGLPDYPYARDKAEADRLCQLWALRHPERTMTIVRPCIVFGPTVDNYIVRFFTRQPFQPDLGGPDVPIQFVHEDDLLDALWLLLEGRHAGAFNVAGDGVMTVSETAALAGQPRRRMPARLFRALAAAAWRLRVSEAPPGQIHFLANPWIVATDRLEEATGWRPRHTSRETFEITMRAHGKLPPGETPAEPPQVAAPVGA